MAAVIVSGRAAAEAAASFGVSWWLVHRAPDSAALALPDVDALAPRMLGIDEHRYPSVRFFRDPASKAWKRYGPWMTTIFDLDTGQVLRIVDGRDSEGVGDWLFARPLEWRLGVQVVAIDPSAAFRASVAHATARAVSFARGPARWCSSLNVVLGQSGSAQRQARLAHSSRTGLPKHGTA